MISDRAQLAGTLTDDIVTAECALEAEKDPKKAAAALHRVLEKEPENEVRQLWDSSGMVDLVCRMPQQSSCAPSCIRAIAKKQWLYCKN